MVPSLKRLTDLQGIKHSQEKVNSHPVVACYVLGSSKVSEKGGLSGEGESISKCGPWTVASVSPGAC